MEDTAFFDNLQAQFDDALPFVVYRKPNERTVNAVSQINDTLYKVNDFSESGFIFAPFDANVNSTIIIPSEHSFLNYLEFFDNKTPSNKNIQSLHFEITQESRIHHTLLVKKGIDEIEKTMLKKVVLSRKQKVPHDYESPIQIFKRLLATYPTAFVYCWYHPKIGLWLGATPETLLSVKNRRLHTMSLAGTQKITDKKDISWGKKELQEQQFVTDSIIENLEGLVDDLIVSDVTTHQAGTLLHLKTDISAVINENETKLSSIIAALHPTPAVCGLPKKLAKKFILENENYNRSYYTGFLGELNIKKEKKRASTRRNVENLAYAAIKKHTSLFVNLRCMEVDAQGVKIYVGGGITASSDPESEWDETVSKLQTMGNVLSSES